MDGWEFLITEGGRGGDERVSERRSGGKKERGGRSEKRGGLRPSTLNPQKTPYHLPPKAGLPVKARHAGGSYIKNFAKYYLLCIYIYIYIYNNIE